MSGEVSSSSDTFNSWLTSKLRSLNAEADTETFVAYLLGILDVDDEENEDECLESIQGILEEMTESKAEDHAKEIMDQWKKVNGGKRQKKSEENLAFEDKLTSLIEKQVKEAKVKPKHELTAEQKALKQSILSQYANLPDGEETDSDDAEDSLKQNLNAQLVMDKEKEERDKNKYEAEKKKVKDKEDRERQKQLAQERKEAEHKRTQKGERRQ